MLYCTAASYLDMPASDDHLVPALSSALSPLRRCSYSTVTPHILSTVAAAGDE